MKFYIKTDENNNFIKLYLNKHRVDELLISEKELMGLYILIVGEGSEDYLLKHLFSLDRFNELLNKRILFKVRVEGNRKFYSMKNRYYKSRIMKHYSQILNLDNSEKAFEWAIKNGYTKIEIEEFDFFFSDDLKSKMLL